MVALIIYQCYNLNIEVGGENVKKFLLVIISFVLLLTIGCGKEEHVDGELADLMEKVYAGIKEDEKPMMLTNIEVTSENAKNFLGKENLEFESALASESGVGSIAHSVVLVRAKDGQDVEQLKKDIKENINPHKWICVEVAEDKVIVDNIGDLVILIMNNDIGERIHNNFKNLK